MKIVINCSPGGFSVSYAVINELGLDTDLLCDYGCCHPKNKDLNINSDNWDEYRSDPRLIAAIEKVGLEKSAGLYSELKIVEVPDGTAWYLERDTYTGREWVTEVANTWG